MPTRSLRTLSVLVFFVGAVTTTSSGTTTYSAYSSFAHLAAGMSCGFRYDAQDSGFVIYEISNELSRGCFFLVFYTLFLYIIRVNLYHLF